MYIKLILSLITIFLLLGCESKKKFEKIEYEEVNITKESLLRTIKPVTDMGSEYWDAQQKIDDSLQKIGNSNE